MDTSLYPITVKAINKETADTVSLSFDIPADLRSTFKYQAGQYLTLEAKIFGEKVRRAYSLCSCPLDDEWQVAIKTVPEGKFSTFANTILAVGDTLDVMPPQGKFVIPALEEERNYLCFAAGSGITPILSIVKTILRAQPNANCTLIYGNRSFESIIFFEELEALKNMNLERLSIHHVLSKEVMDAPIQNGRIDAEKVDQFSQGIVDFHAVNDVFICGPEQMTLSLLDKLPTMGVEKKNIHFELFTTAGESKEKKIAKQDPALTGKSAEVSITLDGKTITFPLGFNDKNILDAALNKGADLPFACKGGVCCTCRAKVVEGEVEMDVNYALAEDEVEAGFVLTCQSHPRTDKVHIDFDQQ